MIGKQSMEVKPVPSYPAVEREHSRAETDLAFVWTEVNFWHKICIIK